MAFLWHFSFVNTRKYRMIPVPESGIVFIHRMKLIPLRVCVSPAADPGGPEPWSHGSIREAVNVNLHHHPTREDSIVTVVSSTRNNNVKDNILFVVLYSHKSKTTEICIILNYR
jgi:hypothetical protein